jgi:hypothetical protein
MTVKYKVILFVSPARKFVDRMYRSTYGPLELFSNEVPCVHEHGPRFSGVKEVLSPQLLGSLLLLLCIIVIGSGKIALRFRQHRYYCNNLSPITKIRMNVSDDTTPHHHL